MHGLSFEPPRGEKAPYYNVRVGYGFGEAPASFGLGLEVFHFKIVGETSDVRRITGTHGGLPVAARAPVDAAAQRFERSKGLHDLNVEALDRSGLLKDAQTFSRGRLQLYGEAGAGPAVPCTASTIDGVRRTAGSEVGGVGVEGFAGLRFLLGKPLGVFVEPKYTHMWLTVGVATGGHADVTEPSAQVVGGLTVVSPWAWTSG